MILRKKRKVCNMKYNKKLSLWLLLVGMLYLSTEQVQAGISKNNMYAIMAATAGAASCIAYLVYQDYCKQQIELKKKLLLDDMSFDQYLDFINVQFQSELLAKDFDPRIIALYMHGFCVTLSLQIIESIKKCAHDEYAAINMSHCTHVFGMIENSDVDDFQRTDDKQVWLNRAYHQAAHAVAVIELMNPDVALYNIFLNSDQGGFIYCPLDKDISSEKQLKMYEDSIMFYFAGGIGEQLFNVSPLPGFRNDIDMSDYDKNDDWYQYIDMITRNSVVSDISSAVHFADLVLYFSCIDAGGSVEQCSVINDEDIHHFTLSLYHKIYAILAKNNEKIKKIAELLVEQGSVSADEAYAICGKKRPLFYFEKE